MPFDSVAAPTKAGHGFMRNINRALVLDTIKQRGPVSRVEIVEFTRLSKPTVSAIVDELAEAGLVSEAGFRPTRARGGRPAALIAYNPTAVLYAGIHFGSHHTHVLLADGKGGSIASRELEASPANFRKAVSGLGRELAAMTSQAGVSLNRLAAIGVAIPGPVSPDGVLAIAPNLGWHDIPVRRKLQQAFGVPVVVGNIKDTAALAEGDAGVASDYRSFAWVYAGTGIGAGVVVDGVLLSGSRGFAGELGHCQVRQDGPPCNCGRIGCLEPVANSAAVEAAYAAAVGPKMAADVREILLRAKRGDRAAIHALLVCGEELGAGIAYLVNLFDPEAIIVGGPLIAGDGGTYLDAARESTARRTMARSSIPILPSQLGPAAPLLGALLMAMQASKPTGWPPDEQ